MQCGQHNGRLSTLINTLTQMTQNTGAAVSIAPTLDPIAQPEAPALPVLAPPSAPRTHTH